MIGRGTEPYVERDGLNRSHYIHSSRLVSRAARGVAWIGAVCAGLPACTCALEAVASQASINS